MQVTVEANPSLVDVLALCALSDLAAVPLLLSADSGAPPRAIGTVGIERYPGHQAERRSGPEHVASDPRLPARAERLGNRAPSRRPSVAGRVGR